MLRFFGFGESLEWKRGTFKSLTDPYGGTDHVTEAKTWDNDGKITKVERTGTIPGSPPISEPTVPPKSDPSEPLPPAKPPIP